MKATKIDPSPLDAFESAKPDEPIYTIQGGDPLGAPLLRIWAIFARIQARVIPDQGTAYVYQEILKAANNNPPENENEAEGLLIRATETEQISWTMDNYRNGLSVEEIAEVKRASEVDRLDIFDLRRRTCQCIANFFSEFNDFRLELIKREYMIAGDYIDHQIMRVEADLRYIMSTIEIKRG